MFYAFRQVARAEATAEREYQCSEGLLANILPPKVAKRLKEQPETTIADAYPAASILFTDMAGFTARASDTTPEELVAFLNGLNRSLDGLVERHGLECRLRADFQQLVIINKCHRGASPSHHPSQIRIGQIASTSKLACAAFQWILPATAETSRAKPPTTASNPTSCGTEAL